MAAVRHEVKALRLDGGLIESHPLHIVAGKLRVRRRLGIFGDGLDSRRTVDGLLGTDDIGETAIWRVSMSYAMARNRGFFGKRLTSAWPS